MKRTVIVASAAETKEAPSIYSLLKMRLMELSKELEQKSLEVQQIADRLIDEISSNRYPKQ